MQCAARLPSTMRRRGGIIRRTARRRCCSCGRAAGSARARRRRADVRGAPRLRVVSFFTTPGNWWRGAGPYFYLPKLESHLEARLRNSVVLHAQARLGLPKGAIRATVLIETILAAFEMDELLYELRGHSAGLNCGRWDY